MEPSLNTYYVLLWILLTSAVQVDGVVGNRGGFNFPSGGDVANGLCQNLSSPQNGAMDCQPYAAGLELRCTATCNSGYHFTDGSSQVLRSCDQFAGTWYDGKDVPQCVATCSPDCKNGGTCIRPDLCACPNGWIGTTCETAAGRCSNPTTPNNGTLSCHQATSGLHCTVACKTGFKFETPPSTVYSCGTDGTWSPPINTIPNCIRDTVPSGHISTSYTGTCASWGQEHYRTFDGKVYTFEGQCRYVLAKDCASNAFSIHVINDRSCSSGQNCKRELDIFIGSSDVVHLKHSSGGDPVVFWNDAQLTLPTQHDTMHFEKVGYYYTVTNNNQGFRIKWDGRQSIFIQMTDDLKHKTCGLCGLFDGDKVNDFTTSSNAVTTSVISFGTSWKRQEIGQVCPDSTPSDYCSSNPSASAHAATTCHQLMSSAFLQCNSVIPPDDYIEACQHDCCKSGGQDCQCSSFQAYARACLARGIKLNWRTDLSMCAAACPPTMVHKECGSSCPRTCQTWSKGNICRDTSCVDGCFCPDGMAMYGDKCVPTRSCPCYSGNKEYKHGDQTVKDVCNKCTCTDGKWNCGNKTCDATCSATGDPHYMTFDGHRYNFMGTCSYYMVKSPSFEIIADNIKCGHGAEASCTKSVTLNYNGMTIKLDHNHQVFINGKEIFHLPYTAPGIKIYMVSSLFLKAELANGVTVLWDGRTRVYVTAPKEFFGKIIGLCGNFNGRQTDDFITETGDIEVNENAFGNKFKTEATCQNMPEIPTPHPCETNALNKVKAKEVCTKLKSGVFSECLSHVDADQYYDDCMYDMCACSENLADCMCPVFSGFADACTATGVQIDWRRNITECALKCTGGQISQSCGDPCTRTCRNIAESGDCTSRCVEGCNCPPGETLDDNEQCVKIESCPCMFHNKKYDANYTTMMGDQLCTCTGAKWNCVKYSRNVTTGHHPIQPICKNSKMEYTSCVSDCPLTCANFSQTPTCATRLCKAGCVCKAGYVLLGDECVRPSQCPCIHGNKNYYEGEKILKDCNECVCHGQNWICGTKDCPAICSSYGESHYTTFDGKTYNFDGQCDYVLVKSTDGSPQKFLVTTENIQCGTSGVTCTKSIEVTVGEPGTANFYRVQLIRGRPVIVEQGSPFNVTEVGGFLTLAVPGGITIQWDHGTRIYVKVATQHKAKVEGLCGNFDGDQTNDFTPSQGGPPTIKSTLFADSWRLEDHCAPSKQIKDTCEAVVPQRHQWAQKKCGIIKSHIFEPCHHAVNYKEFYDRCVYDACGCDFGGDCECLCTSIAAYAQECTLQGVLIAWRSKEICPMQCEDCKDYTPCMSSCPKRTCDNRIHYDQLTQECKKQMCVEGCDVKPCIKGQIFDNNQTMRCIPETFCDTTACLINGVSYREHEQIKDVDACRPDCEICYCENNDIKRIRHGVCHATLKPTPSTSITDQWTPSTSSIYSSTSNGYKEPSTPSVSPPLSSTMSPTPNIQSTPTRPVSCVNGWTGWMSGSHPSPLGSGDIETIDSLRKFYSFCDDRMIKAIECRVINTNQASAYSGQQVTCDLSQHGLHCYHHDQIDGHPCYDYEVRFNCYCGPVLGSTRTTKIPTPGSDTSTPSPTPGSSVSTPTPGSSVSTPSFTPSSGVSTPTKGSDVSTPSSTPRNGVSTTSFTPSSGISTSTKGSGVSTPSPTPVSSVSTPSFTPSSGVSTPTKGSGVSTPSLTPRSGVSTPSLTSSSGVSTPTKGSGVSTPSPTPGSGVSTPSFTLSSGVSTPTTGSGVSTPSPTPGSSVSTPSFTPSSGVSTSTKGSGVSTPSPKPGSSHKTPITATTPSPSPGTGTKTVSPPVTSNTQTPTVTPGITPNKHSTTDLTPTGSTNTPPIHSDTQTPTLTSGKVPTTPSQDTPTGITHVPPDYSTTPATNTLHSCTYTGWSHWINSAFPTNIGDIESLPELQKRYALCDEVDMKYIQCREVGSKLSYDKTGDIGVTCNTNAGFLCYNSQQNGGKCKDYEIRVYCLCSTKICNSPLVSEQQYVKDNMLTASSTYEDNPAYGPTRSRINTTQNIVGFGGWKPKFGDTSPWIQVDFGEPVELAGITTKGRSDALEWVTKYKIQISGARCDNFMDIPGPDGKTEVFDGNTDSITPVTHMFTNAFFSRCLRLLPLEFNGASSLRFDVIGCRSVVPSDITTVSPEPTRHTGSISTESPTPGHSSTTGKSGISTPPLHTGSVLTGSPTPGHSSTTGKSGISTPPLHTGSVLTGSPTPGHSSTTGKSGISTPPLHTGSVLTGSPTPGHSSTTGKSGISTPSPHTGSVLTGSPTPGHSSTTGKSGKSTPSPHTGSVLTGSPTPGYSSTTAESGISTPPLRTGSVLTGSPTPGHSSTTGKSGISTPPPHTGSVLTGSPTPGHSSTTGKSGISTPTPHTASVLTGSPTPGHSSTTGKSGISTPTPHTGSVLTGSPTPGHSSTTGKSGISTPPLHTGSVLTGSPTPGHSSTTGKSGISTPPPHTGSVLTGSLTPGHSSTTGKSGISTPPLHTGSVLTGSPTPEHSSTTGKSGISTPPLHTGSVLTGSPTPGHSSTTGKSGISTPPPHTGSVLTGSPTPEHSSTTGKFGISTPPPHTGSVLTGSPTPGHSSTTGKSGISTPPLHTGSVLTGSPTPGHSSTTGKSGISTPSPHTGSVLTGSPTPGHSSTTGKSGKSTPSPHTGSVLTGSPTPGHSSTTGKSGISTPPPHTGSVLTGSPTPEHSSTTGKSGISTPPLHTGSVLTGSPTPGHSSTTGKSGISIPPLHTGSVLTGSTTPGHSSTTGKSGISTPSPHTGSVLTGSPTPGHSSTTGKSGKSTPSPHTGSVLTGSPTPGYSSTTAESGISTPPLRTGSVLTGSPTPGHSSTTGKSGISTPPPHTGSVLTGSPTPGHSSTTGKSGISTPPLHTGSVLTGSPTPGHSSTTGKSGISTPPPHTGSVLTGSPTPGHSSTTGKSGISTPPLHTGSVLTGSPTPEHSSTTGKSGISTPPLHTGSVLTGSPTPGHSSTTGKSGISTPPPHTGSVLTGSPTPEHSSTTGKFGISTPPPHTGSVLTGSPTPGHSSTTGKSGISTPSPHTGSVLTGSPTPGHSSTTGKSGISTPPPHTGSVLTGSPTPGHSSTTGKSGISTPPLHTGSVLTGSPTPEHSSTTGKSGISTPPPHTGSVLTGSPTPGHSSTTGKSGISTPTPHTASVLTGSPTPGHSSTTGKSGISTPTPHTGSVLTGSPTPGHSSTTGKSGISTPPLHTGSVLTGSPTFEHSSTTGKSGISTPPLHTGSVLTGSPTPGHSSTTGKSGISTPPPHTGSVLTGSPTPEHSSTTGKSGISTPSPHTGSVLTGSPTPGHSSTTGKSGISTPSPHTGSVLTGSPTPGHSSTTGKSGKSTPSPHTGSVLTGSPTPGYSSTTAESGISTPPLRTGSVLTGSPTPGHLSTTGKSGKSTPSPHTGSVLTGSPTPGHSSTTGKSGISTPSPHTGSVLTGSPTPEHSSTTGKSGISTPSPHTGSVLTGSPTPEHSSTTGKSGISIPTPHTGSVPTGESKPTVTPVSSQSTTVVKSSIKTPVPTICIEGATPWMNIDSPALQKTFETAGSGDYELLPELHYYYGFCQRPVSIECRVAGSHEPHFLSGDRGVRCNILDGLICLNGEQTDSLCSDYEVRVTCDCGETPPTKPAITGTCMWTEWMNSHHKTSKTLGDYETFGNLREHYQFCDRPTGIECRKVPDPHNPSGMSYIAAGQRGVSCNLNQGLVCEDGLQGGAAMCFDYEVRVFCSDGCPDPSHPPTPGSTSTRTVTPHLPGRICNHGWTEVMNIDSPKNSNGGDFETVETLRTDHTFCDVSRIIDVKCLKADTLTLASESKQVITCEKAVGLKCRDIDQLNGEACFDYAVKFFCDCADSTPSTHGQSPTPTVSSTSSGATITPSLLTHNSQICSLPMGVSNPQIIGKDQFTASTSFNYQTDADKARLNGRPSAWMPRFVDKNQWIQVDLRHPELISGIVTQGDSGSDNWVTRYKVLTSFDGHNFIPYMDIGERTPKVFTANSDRNTIITGAFDREILARYVRIQPATWHNYIAMRFEILSCQGPPISTTTVTTRSIPVHSSIPPYNTPSASPGTHSTSPTTHQTPPTGSSHSTGQTPNLTGSQPTPTGTSSTTHSTPPMSGSHSTGQTPYVPGSQPTRTSSTTHQTPPTDSFHSTGQTPNLTGSQPTPTGTSSTTHPTPPMSGSHSTGQTPGSSSYKTTLTVTTPQIVTQVCQIPMGLENNLIIGSNQLTASSSLNGVHTPDNGRIYKEGWAPLPTDNSPWIQVDFKSSKIITGVQTQGSELLHRWVSKFYVYTSTDGKTFTPYKDKITDNLPKLFIGNTNAKTPLLNLFNRNVTAQFVRITPIAWTKEGVGLRFNVFGCNPSKTHRDIITPAPNTPYTGTGVTITPTMKMISSTESTDCRIPMGVENPHIIHGTQFSATSSLDGFHGPDRGRLYTQKVGDFAGGWQPLVSDGRQYIQLDLLAPYKVSGVSTQGSSSSPNWVTKYEVYYSVDGQSFFPIPAGPNSNDIKQFIGNTDQNTPVTHFFPIVSARFIRIHPVEWHSGIGMRFNIWGCDLPVPVPDGTTIATPTLTPVTSCRYWTPWVNTNKANPDLMPGDFETVWQINQFVKVCPAEKMKELSCRRVSDHAEASIAGEGAICDQTTKTLTCMAPTCSDYEIRVLCDECDILSPTTPQDISTTQSVPFCTHSHWLDWINRDKPTTGNGDTEMLTDTEKANACIGGKITKIECNTTAGIPSYSTGEIIHCAVDTGLTCDNRDNFPVSCSDYQVRYFCQCSPTASPTVTHITPSPGSSTTLSATPGSSTTVSPTPGSSTTVSPTPHSSTSTPVLNTCTRSVWSSFLDRNKPSVGDGDREMMTQAEKDHFCPGGKITHIECYTDANIPSASSGEVMTCDLMNGLICNNRDNFPVPCSNYKVKYFCECGGTSTVSSTPQTSTTQKQTINVRCTWSPWLNTDRPNNGDNGGDMETVEQLKNKYGLCRDIADIECRVAGSHISSTAVGQSRVSCDVMNGLRCYNREQLSNECYDYEVRVLCWSPECSGIPTTPSEPTPVKVTVTPPTHIELTPDFSTTKNQLILSTTSMCVTGEVWKACPYRCEELCVGFQRTTTICHNALKSQCVPGCVPINYGCPNGYKLSEQHICVQQALCSCRMQNGTIARPYDTWTNPENHCEECRCIDNQVHCVKNVHCDESTTVSVPTPKVHPQCYWTDWINVDMPSTGQGDVESISQIRLYNTFCSNPAKIMCRKAGTDVESSMTGQRVTCDLNAGLTCDNFENGGNCFDYEVRFYCPCSGSTTASPSPGITTTHKSSTRSTRKYTSTPLPGIKCGWTGWMNGNNPDEMGEIESLSSLRAVYNFCDISDVTNIECRQADTHILLDKRNQNNVICDVNNGGLMCFNSGERCLDYEIRVLCEPAGMDCSPASTVTTPSISPTMTGSPTPHISTVSPTIRHTSATHIITPETSRLKTPITQSPTPTSKITPPPGQQCISGWTDWSNKDSPNTGNGDHEYLTREELTSLCHGGSITQIDCKTTANIPWYSSGEIVTCNKDTGLTCNNGDNAPVPCSDYTVRYYCDCPVITPESSSTKTPETSPTKTPTPQSSTPTSTITPPPGQQCISGWTDWSNKDNPNTGNGDHEYLTREELTSLCHGGSITQIDCKTTANIPWYSSGEIVTCNKDTGLTCNNGDNAPVPCSDYTVRYYCDCPVITPESSPTKTPETSPTKTPTTQAPTPTSTITPPPGQQCISGWTDWSNKDNPNTGNGDLEYLTREELTSLCHGGSITQIDCKTTANIPWYSSGEIVTCNKDTGLTCNNGDNAPVPCSDYTVRYYCDCPVITPESSPTKTSETSPTKTPTPQSSTPTSTITPPPGQHCISGWTDWSNKDNPNTGNGDHEYLTREELTSLCHGGSITQIDCKTTANIPWYSSGEIVTCNKDTGLTCNNGDNAPVPCSDYTVRYYCDCPVVAPTTPSVQLSTQTPTAQKTTPSSTEKPTPSSTLGNQCTNGWSDWSNKDSPNTDNREHEYLTNAELSVFCSGGNITQIQCQTMNGIPHYSSGEIVTCKKETGLTCNNADNAPVPCSDYEVRYYCQCPVLFTPKPFKPVTADDYDPTTSVTSTGSTESIVSQTPVTPVFDECQEKMGLENHQLRDDMVTASSYRDGFTGASMARLYGPGAWVAGVQNKKQWIQVDFIQPRLLTGLITQGRPGVPSFVTSYTVSYSLDGFIWNAYQEVAGTDKIFSGNFDSDSPVTQHFSRPVKARFFRIDPRTYNNMIAMRFEVIGCYSPYPTSTVPYVTGTGITGFETPSTTPSLFEKCIVWEEWANTGHITLTSGGDREPIIKIIELAKHCKHPVEIECRLASVQKLPHDETGQLVSCSLLTGLMCKNSDQISRVCYDYEVRIGCLKNVPECIDQTPAPTTPTSAPILPCFEGMDTSKCPSAGCPNGTFCDGLHCVQRTQCSCIVDGHVIRHGDVIQDSKCQSCSCFGGLVTCLETNCPDCPAGQTQRRDVNTCACSCESCAVDEFRCASQMCIPTAARCDGIIDCIDDEVGCTSTPTFTLPHIPPKRTTIIPVISTHSPPHTVSSNTAEVQHTTEIYKQTSTLRYFNITKPPGPCDNVHCLRPIVPRLREGQVSRLVKTADGCCDEYLLSCHTALCITPDIECIQPMVLKRTDTDDCCPHFECVCPSTCPTSNVPHCEEGSLLIEIMTECNCTRYACTVQNPPTVSPIVPGICEYTMLKQIIGGIEINRTTPQPITFHAGQSWSDGLCKTCECRQTRPGSITEISCHHESCSTCKLGETRTKTPGRCCGECQQIGCVVDGHVYKANEHIPGNMHCYTKICKQGTTDGVFYIEEKQEECPALNSLPSCKTNESQFDAAGCCARCNPIPSTSLTCQACAPKLMYSNRRDTIGFFHVKDNGVVCRNEDPIQDLKECSGSCGSVTKYTDLARGLENKCLCCSPKVTMNRSINLRCSDGRVIAKTYTVPTSCECGNCV